MSTPDNFEISDEKIEKNERERIINHLRLIAKLEDLFGVDEINSTKKYHLNECKRKLCGCKKNIYYSPNHQHIGYNENQLVKDLKLELINHQVAKDNSWFRIFPDIVKEIIFKYCNNYALAQLSLAFPEDSSLILNPKYWITIEVRLTHEIFDDFEMSEILKHIGNNLKIIHFELDDVEFVDYEEGYLSYTHKYLNSYFDLLPKLTHLKIDSAHIDSDEFIDLITTKLPLLEILEGDNWLELNNTHLIKLTMLKNLHSTRLRSKMDTNNTITDRGLMYFINTLKKIVFLTIVGDHRWKVITDKSINTLFNTHSSTLEAFGYDYIQFGETGFQEISVCKNLKEIYIGEDNTQGIEFLEYLNKLNTLESLQIHKCLKLGDNVLFKCFTSANFLGTLKRLHLKETNLRDKTLILIANSCPLLECLVLEHENYIADDGIERALRQLKEIKSLSLNYLKENLTFKYFKDVPHQFLVFLEFLNIVRKTELKNKEIWFENILRDKSIQFNLDVVKD